MAGEGLESAEMKGEVTPAECAGKNVTACLCLQSREGTQERERREERGVHGIFLTEEGQEEPAGNAASPQHP